MLPVRHPLVLSCPIYTCLDLSTCLLLHDDDIINASYECRILDLLSTFSLVRVIAS
jgi:hypothetical protein